MENNQATNAAVTNTISQLAVSQEGSTTTAPVVNQDQNAVNSGVQQPTKNVSTTVPYERFQEILHERNALADRIAQQEAARLAQSAQVQASNVPSNDPYASIQSVPELVKAIRAEVSQVVAQQQQPILSLIDEAKVSTNINNYLSSNPEAAKVRDQMLQVYGTLPIPQQRFIENAVRAGDTTVLDGLYFRTVQSLGNQTQQMVSQQVAQSVANSQTPQQFKTIREGGPSFKDMLNSASYERNPAVKEEAWKGVMGQIARQAGI